MAMLVDTHAHVNDPRLLPHAAEIANSLAGDGIEAVINVGYCRKTSEVAVELANAHAPFFAAVGIHPHNAKDLTRDDLDAFAAHAKRDKVVAYGEIGLDFFHNLSAPEVQKRALEEQLAFANDLQLPVILHLRDAFQEMLAVLKNNRHYLKNGVVLHCYTGSAEYHKELRKIAPIYVAFGGAITFQNAKKEEVVTSIPSELLLVETDCPYLTPHPHRGQLNYPKYINLVAQKIQEWRPNDDIAALTTHNAKTLFRKLSCKPSDTK